MRLFEYLIALLNRKNSFLFFVVLVLVNKAWAQPTISSVSPASAAIGSTVVIRGTNFSAIPSNNFIYFGPVKAAVSSASNTSLSVVVPAGSGNQPISVTTNNFTAYTPYPFRVIAGTTLTANSFSVKNDFASLGGYPSGIAAADFNGDGKTDLVCTNWSSSNISIFKNISINGTVAFERASIYPSGVYPDAAATGDLNSDGLPDLVITSTGNHWFSIFINTSTVNAISFAPRIDIAGAANTGPRGILLFDMDGDGRTDVVVPNNEKNIDFSTNSSYGTVSIHKNTGNGAAVSFAAPLVLKMVDYPRKITAGDIDGDGKADLVVASQVIGGVYVFRNKSTPGNLSFDPYVNFGTGTNTEQSALSDLDNDGKLDLIVTNLTNSNIAVLRNTSSPGTISFTSKQVLPGVSPLGMAIGDVDGDAQPDLAVANYGLNKVSVWRNTSRTGIISFAPRMDFASGNGTAEVFLGDIDGDGYPDLSLTNTLDNNVTVLTIAAAPPTLNLGKDTTLCEGDSLLLDATKPNAQYEWSTGDVSASLMVRNPGTYWLKLTTAGITVSDTITITFKKPPAVNLGSDLLICDNETSVLHTGVSNAAYSWQDGSHAESMVVTNAGSYWVQILKDGCTASDTIIVSSKPSPIVNLGSDTTICSGDALVINVFQNNATDYTWQDGSSAPQFTTGQPGKYWVNVKSTNNCSSSDTIKLFIKTAPSINWDNDTVICSDPVLLSPKISDGSYLWQNGSTDSVFKVTMPGSYTLQATNECGIAQETISITQGLCDLLMPNAFTPNADGNNDVFRVKYPQFIKQFRMQVFNRWGQVVFMTSDPHGGWNGSHSGKQQPIGNYIWVISLVNLQGQSRQYSGTVLLIR
jgi:gliding motility-associated-like protein